MRLGAWIPAASLAASLIAGIARPACAEPPPSLVPLAPAVPAEPPASVPQLTPAQDLSGLMGRAITRVDVHVLAEGWDDVPVPRPVRVRVGEELSGDTARRALDEVLGSGAFARGRVSATPDGAGAALVVDVVARKLVDRLRLDVHGAAIDREELLRQAGLSEGGEIVAGEESAIARRIEAYLALHGYPAGHAEVVARQTSDPLRALVLVDVAAGAPRVIGERSFSAFGASRDEVLDAARAYGVRVRDRADEPALDRADTTLEQLLRGKGWYRAEVSHDLARVASGPRAGTIVLRVRIDAGPLFVARFDGNEHYDADVLTAVLGIESETDRSPLHLADKVRAFYANRGFLDAEVRPELRPGESLDVIVFHIAEHARVRVTERSYPCLNVDAIRHLSAGGPRSPAQIGTEIDSYLDEDLPGADLLVDPDPRGLDATLEGSGRPGRVARAPHPAPLDLEPDATFVAGTYDRAAEHVQELYRNEGFLHAEVGPVGIVRARCDPRSPPGRCVPVPLPPLPADVCTYDAAGLPAPTEPLPPELTCRPDPAHGIECAPTVKVVMPIKLGPRTQIWDVGFTGVKATTPRELADAAQLPLGDAASAAHIEDARRRIVDWYKERGYAYADVRYALETSPDGTRARVRFDVSEGDLVLVRAIVVRGLRSTNESVVLRRVALAIGQPYRQSDVRKTQERVSTLGVFSSVTVSLSDPNVPQANKDVIVDVVEREPQHVEVRYGFSTGEGVRGAIEHTHRNLLGEAWSTTLHLEASYLPDFLILDRGVAANFDQLSTWRRIATRDTLTFAWPEIGLGPTIRAQLDGVFVNDLERDFTLRKAAVVGTLIWRPVREFQISFGPDYENNYVYLFGGGSIQMYLASQTNPALNTLLRVPDGESNVVATRAVLTWDRRDNTFSAHRGTFLAVTVEQVNSYPVGNVSVAGDEQYQSHFFRLMQTFAAYLPITKSITFAAELRAGENVTPWCSQRPSPGDPAHWSCTYPDRLFFMGGFDSMRGWLQDSFIPQDYVDQIAKTPSLCTNNQTNCPLVPIRGGNLMLNPRAELRFPIRLPIEAAIFGDLGNVWVDPSYIASHPLSVRADVGAGLRVDTPVGPLVFDYGINVTRKPYEDFGAFHFAIGLF